MIAVRGYINPTVINTVDGTFAVSGSNWVEVPVGTKLKDIKWIDTKPKIKKSKSKSWKIKDYTVIFNKDFYSCNCLGYTYRRKCKHITEVSELFKGTKNGRSYKRSKN
jgi:hypothetical protein|tara:strand:+ start:307 stop:630 length:324 start_codon:yes stop_codon:yes gene_type:complete